MLSNSNKNKVLKAHSERNGSKKASKSGGLSRSGRGRNNGKEKWKSKILMLDKKLRNQKSQLSFFSTVAKPSSDNEDSDDLYKVDVNRKHSDLTHKGKSKRSKKA